MSRARAGALAAIGVVATGIGGLGAGLALADTDPVPPVPGTSTTPPAGGATRSKALGWSLIGVARGGRALLVRPASYGGCDQGPPVVTLTQTATAVTVSVAVRTPTDDTVVCPQIAVLPPTQTVALPAPIAGRPISGPLRVTRPGSAYLDAAPTSTPPRVPRVVGLRAADARSVLCAWGLRAKAGAGRATVSRQAPKAGVASTAPSSPPASCAQLPATITLRTR